MSIYVPTIKDLTETTLNEIKDLTTLLNNETNKDVRSILRKEIDIKEKLISNVKSIVREIKIEQIEKKK